jgi:hypothetical protein
MVIEENKYQLKGLKIKSGPIRKLKTIKSAINSD